MHYIYKAENTDVFIVFSGGVMTIAYARLILLKLKAHT